MKVAHAPRFLRDYGQLDPHLKRRVDKQIVLLLKNPRHPSLRIHKMVGYPDIYEARLTKGYRFTFQIRGETCFLRRVGTHDILKTPLTFGPRKFARFDQEKCPTALAGG